MIEVKLTWHGDELLRQISEAQPDAMFNAAQTLLESAKAKAPRRRGDLGESGYVATEHKSTYKPKKIHNKEKKAPKGGAIVAFAAFYARYQEFGTKKMAAHPYLRPALDELKEQLGKEIVVKIGQKLK